MPKIQESDNYTHTHIAANKICYSLYLPACIDSQYIGELNCVVFITDFHFENQQQLEFAQTFTQTYKWL